MRQVKESVQKLRWVSDTQVISSISFGRLTDQAASLEQSVNILDNVDRLTLTLSLDDLEQNLLQHLNKTIGPAGVIACPTCAAEYDPATDIISPSAYAGHAASWVEAGATIVGGCCGIGPSHLKAVVEHFRG